MLTDFTAILSQTLSSLSTFLATPPVSYLMGVIIMSAVFGFYKALIFGKE